MILLIDNYDSFTYNICQMIGALNPDIRVCRNDALTLADLRRLQPEQIIFSPGPGYPGQAGLMLRMIQEFYPTIPMLGICLGHQGIAEAFGGKIIEAPEPVHGKQDLINLNQDCPLFSGQSPEMPVGRYHSLVVDPASLPSCLKVTARHATGLIMGIQHRVYPVFGLQFHPESILTPGGQAILQAFLAIKPFTYDKVRPIGS